jgi:glutaredoxin
VKAWLSQAGVPFAVRRVDDDLDAYRDLVARGFRTVPVTFMNDRAVVGFDADALAAALSAARGPADPAAP